MILMHISPRKALAVKGAIVSIRDVAAACRIVDLLLLQYQLLREVVLLHQQEDL